MVFTTSHGYWYFGRPSIEELRQDLRQSQESASGLGHRQPEMNTAWKRGEKDRFGKSYTKV